MKRLLLIFIALFLIFPNVNAISVDIQENYFPRETIVVKLEGNFLDPIRKENIFFYSDRIKVPMEYDLARVDEYYYLYTVLPNKERNYTLIIENVHYFEAGEEKTEDLNFNFSVEGPVADFTVKPGFIVTDKSFELTIESNVRRVEVEADYLDFSTSIEVPAGSSKKITLPAIHTPEVSILEVKSDNFTYSLPIKILTYPKKVRSIAISPAFLNTSLFRGSPLSIQLYVENRGQETIKNISLMCPCLNVSFSPNNIRELEPNSFAEINISSMPLESQAIILYAISDELSANATILINVLTVTIQNFTSDEIRTFSCFEIGGNLCEDEETCTGEPTETIEGECCIGDCKKPTSFLKIFIILLILAALAGIGYYVFMRVKKGKSSKDFLKQQQEKYSERFKEVRHGLTKT